MSQSFQSHAQHGSPTKQSGKQGGLRNSSKNHPQISGSNTLNLAPHTSNIMKIGDVSQSPHGSLSSSIDRTNIQKKWKKDSKAGESKAMVPQNQKNLQPSSLLEEVKEELRGEQILTDRYEATDRDQYTFQGSQGGQGGQGDQGIQGTAQIREYNGHQQEPPISTFDQEQNLHEQNLQRIEQKIDLIMETQQKQMKQKQQFQYGNKNVSQQQKRGNKDWKKATSLYQRGDRVSRISAGAHSMNQGDLVKLGGPPNSRFVGHLAAPNTVGSRVSDYRERSQHIYKNSSIMSQSLSRTQRAQERKLTSLGNQIRLRTAGHEIDQSNSIETLGDNKNKTKDGRPTSNQEDWNEKIRFQNQADLLTRRPHESINSNIDSGQIMRNAKNRPDQLYNKNGSNSAQNSSMNQFDAKLRTLKKMYNQQVKSDYTEGGNAKTSIRNRKNRISHDVAMASTVINFDTKRTSATGANNGFAQETSLTATNSNPKNPTRKKQLVINDAYQESINMQKLSQVSRSLGVSKKNQAGSNIQNALFLGGPLASSQATPVGGNSAIYSNKKFVQSKGKGPNVPGQALPKRYLQPINANKVDAPEFSYPISASSQDKPLAPIIPKQSSKMQGSRQGIRQGNGEQIGIDLETFQEKMLGTSYEPNAENQFSSNSQASHPSKPQSRKQALKQKRDVIQSIYQNPFKTNPMAAQTQQNWQTNQNTLNLQSPFIQNNHIRGQSQVVTSSGRQSDYQPNKFVSTNNGPTTLGARESNSVNRNIGGKKKLGPLNNALALEPLSGPYIKKVSKMKQVDVSFPEITESQQALDNAERVEDLSDYEENLSNAHQFSEIELQPSIESKQARNKQNIVIAKKPPGFQQLQKLPTPNLNNIRPKNRSPMPSNPYTKNQSSSNSKNKYDQAAARYKAETYIAQGQKITKEKPETNSAKLSNSNKNSTDNTRDQKFQQSPYQNNIQGVPGNTTGLSHTSGGQTNKRQLAQRQQRAIAAPQIQGNPNQLIYHGQNGMHTNFQSPQNHIQASHLKVHKVYSNATGSLTRKQQKPPQSQASKTKKEQKVMSAIEKINLKIDGLNQNLENYQQEIDLTLQEIPRDIRSMNNSNFNNSSSRQYHGDTDRNTYDKITNKTYRTSHGNGKFTVGGGRGDKQSEINEMDKQQMLEDNLSDKTLKTIADFKSERAQTQQQRRMHHLKNNYESTQNCRPQESYLSHASQINSNDIYRIVTSRHSRQRPQAGTLGIAGMMGPLDVNNIDHDSGIHLENIGNNGMGPQPGNQIQIKPLNMTADQIKIFEAFERNQVNGSVDQLGIDGNNYDQIVNTDERIGRKGHNLTNLSIKMDHTKDITSGDMKMNDIHAKKEGVYLQKTERNKNNKTSFTNLQAYFNQRGINNETNLSNALSVTNSNTNQIQEKNNTDLVNINQNIQINNQSMISSNYNISGGNEDLKFPVPQHQLLTEDERKIVSSVIVSSPNTSKKNQRVNNQNFYPKQAPSRLSQVSAIQDMSQGGQQLQTGTMPISSREDTNEQRK